MIFDTTATIVEKQVQEDFEAPRKTEFVFWDNDALITNDALTITTGGYDHPICFVGGNTFNIDGASVTIDSGKDLFIVGDCQIWSSATL